MTNFPLNISGFRQPPSLGWMDSQDLEWEEIGGHEAAERHIQEIRAGRGLESSSVPRDIVESLKQACKMLSYRNFLKDSVRREADLKLV
jgi:hypothetical protein